jgi:hypothetical protein
MHDQSHEVQRRLRKPNLGLKRLVLAIWQTEVEKKRAVGVALANLVNVSLRHRLHYRLHRILSDGGDRCHVCWLAVVPFIA